MPRHRHVYFTASFMPCHRHIYFTTSCPRHHHIYFTTYIMPRHHQVYFTTSFMPRTSTSCHVIIMYIYFTTSCMPRHHRRLDVQAGQEAHAFQAPLVRAGQARGRAYEYALLLRQHGAMGAATWTDPAGTAVNLSRAWNIILCARHGAAI